MDDSMVVTALDARTNFGRLLRRVEDEGRSLVIEKRGSPRAVLLSIRDYVPLVGLTCGRAHRGDSGSLL